MILPNKWGQGQLFAFSAWDGEVYTSEDFVGVLCGDRLGIRFYTNTKRELAIVKIPDLNFKAVTGDLISAVTDSGEEINIVFAERHLVIGNTAGEMLPMVMTEGDCSVEKCTNVTVQDTADGEYTALGICGEKFAFSYADTKEKAVELAEKGLAMNIAEEKAKKLSFFEKYSWSEDDSYAMLHAKCISTMKTQLLSPEGRMKRIWSTPDRLPHRDLYLWDSVFHAMGMRNLDTKTAESLILALFDVQQESGFIPHRSKPEWSTDITQPPVIAWGTYNVYKKSGNKDFLKAAYGNIKRFLLWCRENRRDTDEELYTWLTGSDVNCRCDESGMDNSPRFDTRSRLQAIDYSCFMANDTRYMSKIAEELGLDDDAEFFAKWYGEIKDAVNAKLWSEEDGFYFDFDQNNGCLHKIWSVSSFLPLFAGICTAERAKALCKHLTDPEEFYTEFPVPSISKRDATFGTDMWRGPVWINYNYMISQGLAEYGFSELADEITDKTLAVLNRWYGAKGTLFEFYDCEDIKAPCELNRKGTAFEPYDFFVRAQSIRDYGWSNTLTADMLYRKYKA
ncbi:MAG: hypothetical protein IJ366_04310 [Clostridia bacterium]|nr:hypothetical protein [Clostridia bacterium]